MLDLDESRNPGTAETPKKARRGSGGRPSQEEAAKRDARIVEIATAIFMERGFDATTIDAVAEAASVGKATLYARYRDKSALFAAVVQRKVDLWVEVSGSDAPTPGEKVADVLVRMGRRMVAAILVPESIAISRIVTAQAIRFPDLAHAIHREAWQRSNASVAAVLEHFAKDGQIVVEDCDMMADLFISLIVGRLSRLALLGIAVDAEQVDRRVEAAVALFLDGVKPRPRGREPGGGALDAAPPQIL
jgi:AcrR family transcriptional regulator